ncbi:MAG: multiheme c-type cytochrome [Georgfuchsia sp.]
MSKESRACLECHGEPGQEKKLKNGEMLPLYVSAKVFAGSMHGDTGCESCHADLDAENHFMQEAAIESRRDYSLSMMESCRMCHEENFTKYDDSLHAALVKEGRPDAPLCSDCHNPHAVRSVKISEPISEVPCAKCHEDIFQAYSKSVHGLARAAKKDGAPICANCHTAHEVKAASMGEGIKDACLSCHENAVSDHKDWLPNAERHFQAISCPVCHSPTAQRRVNLRLYDGVAKQQISEKLGVPQFEKRIIAVDAENEGLDERALWSLLKEFSQDRGGENTILRGRLEVTSGIEAHQISEKSKAISDCNTCHQEGAEAFQSVSLTIAGPDGRPIRHGVQKDVLNSLLATQSVRGFYAIGSTRIKLLDYMLVLVFLGAASVPIGHFTLRLLFRKLREKREAKKNDELAQTDSQSLPGDHPKH